MQKDYSQLPARGMPVLQEWANAIHAQQTEEFAKTLEEKTPEEREKIQRTMGACVQSLIEDLQKLPEQCEKAENDQDPFQTISQLAGRMIKPLFQQAAAAAELPEASQKGFDDMTDGMIGIFPGILRNSAEIYSPENIASIDAFTPLSSIIAPGLEAIEGPMADCLADVAARYHSDLTPRINNEGKEKEPAFDESIFDEAWNESQRSAEEARQGVHAMFSELRRELKEKGSFSLASAQGIAHPDTLEGQYQIQMAQSPKNNFELALRSDPATAIAIPSSKVEIIASQVKGIIAHLGIGSSDMMKEVEKLITETVETQLRMKCVVAGCHSLAEFEEKEKKLAGLKEEAYARLDYSTRLRRDYEMAVAFLADAEDQVEMRHWFDRFEKDEQAYGLYNNAQKQAHLIFFQNLFVLLKEKYAHLQNEISFEQCFSNEVMRNACFSVMVSLRQKMIEVESKLENEIEKTAYYFQRKILETMGPSVIRSELAKIKPNFKMIQAAREMGMNVPVIEEEPVELSEFDLKLSQFASRRDPSANLADLEFMRNMNEKSDEEIILDIMALGAADHAEIMALSDGIRFREAEIIEASDDETMGKSDFSDLPDLIE